MTVKICRFVAFLFVALVLGAGFARLFALPGKMTLPADAYLMVQQIYTGWALLGIAVAGALVSLGTLAWQLRPRVAGRLLLMGLAKRTRSQSARAGRPRAFALTVAALLAIVADVAVVWSFAHPVNQATGNWTFLPDNWLALRAQWEYGHAAGAALDLLAFAALVLSVLVAERPARVRGPDKSSGGRGAPLRFMAVR